MNGGDATASGTSSPVADGGGGREAVGGGEHRPYRNSVRATESATTNAKTLRSKMSRPEVMLWQHLRRQQLEGLRFRRQHPIGSFIADFFCAEVSLVIEIDGASHRGDRKQRDRERDAWMTERGLHVLRFRAAEVLSDLDAVLSTIRREAIRIRETRKTPPPSASPPPPPSTTGEDS
ncbi:MAG: endonuclease domain-containing protein [Planctomycetota bacterium]